MNMNDWQNRTRMLVGDNAVKKLNGAKAIIFGLGGVGGYVAEALARAGIGKLKVVDFDVISETNINRQIIALTNTIGQKKTYALKKRVEQINIDAEVECVDIFVSPDNIGEVITDADKGDTAYIIDAVDNITAKLAIIQRAKALGIPVISSMGTGNKLNPLMYKIDDIYKTSVCPLARIMRRELRNRGIDALPVLYSTETPAIKATPPTSISYMPPVAGFMIAGHVIQELIQEYTQTAY